MSGLSSTEASQIAVLTWWGHMVRRSRFFQEEVLWQRFPNLQLIGLQRRRPVSAERIDR